MLALKSTRLSQAGATHIDWTNPLTRSLVAVAVGGDSILSPANSKPSTRVVHSGGGFDMTGITFVDFGALFNNTGPMSLLSMVVQDSLSAAAGTSNNVLSCGDRATLRCAAASPANNATFYTFNGSSWNEVRTSVRTTEINEIATIIGVHYGAENVVHVRNSSGMSSGSADCSARAATSQPLRLGRDSETNRSCDGVSLLACAWRRGISSAEISSLLSNPWQIFR